MAISEPLSDRLWRKVNRGAPDECWEWTGAKTPKGYGQIGEGAPSRKLLRTHRVAYTLTHGPIPDGMVVMHTCDNPACCNPAHLRLGTQRQNMEDMKAKGRRRGIPAIRGEKHVNAKLSDAAAQEILNDARARKDSQQVIASRHNVSQALVSRILLGKSHAHLQEDD